MDKKEARQIIAEQLQKYRSKSYQELIQMLDSEAITYELTSQNNKERFINRPAPEKPRNQFITET